MAAKLVAAGSVVPVLSQQLSHIQQLQVLVHFYVFKIKTQLNIDFLKIGLYVILITLSGK